MEKIRKITCLVIKAQDFKDSDKLLTLCHSGGVSSALLKGVRKPKSKLKFACQPFNLLSLTLTGNQNMPTVTSGEILESFFHFSTDLERYYVAMAVLECLEIFHVHMDKQTFETALDCFHALNNKALLPKNILSKFLILQFEHAGCGLNFEKCSVCGEVGSFFDLHSGGLVCQNCKQDFSVKLDKNLLAMLLCLSKLDFDGLATYKGDQALATLTTKFLSDIFAENFKRLSSVKQLLLL